MREAVLAAARSFPKPGSGPWKIAAWNEPQGGCVRVLDGWLIVRLVPVYVCGFDGGAIEAVVPTGTKAGEVIEQLRALIG